MRDIGKKIYLNNAATSYPKPDCVSEQVMKCLGSIPYHAQRSGFAEKGQDRINDCRQALAELLRIRTPERLVFTSGATESLNLALFGLGLTEKACVVTTVLEHNSVLRPLKKLEAEGAVQLSIVECDKSGKIDAQDLCNRIDHKTKAVVVNHCSNVTGTLIDLEAIGTFTADKKIPFIVDASQSIGCESIDVEKMHIDLLAFTGHKNLFGMQGIGGLYLNENISLKPLKVGGTGIRSDLLTQPETMPLFFEAGTLNFPGIVSLYAGLEFISKIGLHTISKRKKAIVASIVGVLKEKDNVILYLPSNKGELPATLSFNIKNMMPEDVGYILEHSFGIIVRAGLHCAPLVHSCIGSYPKGTIRLSPSYFTTDEEVDLFLSAMDEITSHTA